MPHAARMELYQNWASLHLDNTAAEFRAAQAQHQTATQSLQVPVLFSRFKAAASLSSVNGGGGVFAHKQAWFKFALHACTCCMRACSLPVLSAA